MASSFRSSLSCLAVAAASAAVLVHAAAAPAAEPAPSIEQVEDARRCATSTRTAGHAFAEVRDSVQAGGTTRALALLDEADDALKAARTACAADPEVMAQLELLVNEAASLRRSLR